MMRPLFHALAFARRPKEFLSSLLESRGDGFTFSLPGLGPIVVTGTAQGAQELFSAPSEQFSRLQNSPVEPILGPESLMLVAGKRHLEERKLLSQPFRGENMRAYGESIAANTLRHLDSVGDKSVFSAQSLARAVALDVIVECVFGVQEPRRKELFHGAISDMMDSYTTPLMVLPWLRFRFFGFSPWDRFLRARARVHRLFREEFVNHDPERVDILGRLLSLDPRPSDSSLLSILCTLLVAGHDTSTIGITWALYYLHRYPETLERLRTELEELGTEPEHLARSPYLKAVCQETLRLNPSVPASIRRLARPFNFCGRHLEKGASVGVALTLLHTAPEVYPEPQKFRPERFLSRRYTPFEYAPFGGGYRRCLGEAFATYEMSIVLGTLVSKTRFRLLEQPEPRAVIDGIAMGPSRPVLLERAIDHSALN